MVDGERQTKCFCKEVHKMIWPAFNGERRLGTFVQGKYTIRTRRLERKERAIL